MKDVIPALHSAFGKVMNPGDPKHQAIELALRMSHKMDNIIDRHPSAIALPTEASSDLRGAAFVFLGQLNYLTQAYSDAGVMVLLAHIALRSGDSNPRRTWCFAGERMMLHVRRLGQSCARSIQASQIGRKLLSKYRCGLLFLLKKQGHDMSEDEINALCEGDLGDLDSMEIDIAED